MDPGARATQLGGFIFGHWDPYNAIQVPAGKAGKDTITWELMGKSLSILHIVVTISVPTPYSVYDICDL